MRVGGLTTTNNTTLTEFKTIHVKETSLSNKQQAVTQVPNHIILIDGNLGTGKTSFLEKLNINGIDGGYLWNAAIYHVEKMHEHTNSDSIAFALANIQTSDLINSKLDDSSYSRKVPNVSALPIPQQIFYQRIEAIALACAPLAITGRELGLRLFPHAKFGVTRIYLHVDPKIGALRKFLQRHDLDANNYPNLDNIQLVASFLNFILYFSHSIFKFLWVNPWRVSNV